LEKSKQNSWIIKVWIAEELFYYAHPFLLPSFFKSKITKDEFEVQFKVIQIFSSVNVEKIFFKIIHRLYPINRKQKYFIQLIKILEEYDLIDSNYKIISNSRFRDIYELTTHNIS
jgi:hypothetical protein